MKEKIRIQRDLDLERINNSEHLSHDEKVYLAGLISDSAEATNGLTHEEKVQSLSETTFGITTAIIKITEQLNENNTLTAKLAAAFLRDGESVKTKVDGKRDIKDLNWMDTAKLILVKPWAWVFLSVLCFTPSGVEMLQTLVQNFASR